MALTRGLPALLEHLPERSLAKKLMAVLREVAGIATEGQLKGVVGASWLAVAAREKEKGRGRSTCCQK